MWHCDNCGFWNHLRTSICEMCAFFYKRPEENKWTWFRKRLMMVRELKAREVGEIR